MLQERIHKKLALVVEDEPAISRACQRALKTEGFDVDIAMNGLIAMKMAKEKNYDLCLSDIRTPEMNGIELFQYLEKEHLDLANRIIFTSGDIMSGNTFEFLKAVKKPFLPKPFTPDELKN